MLIDDGGVASLIDSDHASLSSDGGDVGVPRLRAICSRLGLVDESVPVFKNPPVSGPRCWPINPCGPWAAAQLLTRWRIRCMPHRVVAVRRSLYIMVSHFHCAFFKLESLRLELESWRLTDSII